MKREKSLTLSLWLYIISSAIMLFLVTSLFLSGYNTKPTSGDTIEIIYDNIEFYDSNEEKIENTIDLYKIAPKGTIHCYVPSNLKYNTALCFRILHTYCTVTHNDELLYKSIYNESPFYTNSMGSEWATIEIDKELAGERLDINYELAYPKSRGGFDNIKFETSVNFILNLISSKFGALILCLTYVIVGIMLMILGIIILRMTKTQSSLFWLGCFALSIALYCLLETQVFQIFYYNNRLIHLCIMYTMMLMPMPAIEYSSALLGTSHKWIKTIFAITSFSIFIFSTFLNIFTDNDYHTLLPLYQFMLLVAIVIFISSIAKYTLDKVKHEHKIDIYVKAMALGVGVLMTTGFIDIIRYWMDNKGDPAAITRIGFLLFLVCFALASSEQVIQAFKKSSQAEFISKLAYIDGLTGLFNRTSYQEMLDHIENENIETGIIAMDLNNLKYVNDTFGHTNGDNLIMSAATLIESTFKNIDNATCYRIGGDEFCVLIQNKHNLDSCKRGVKMLKQAYEKYNKNTAQEFRLIIAMGMAIYESGDNLKEKIDLADSNMYENKRKLKENDTLVGEIRHEVQL